MTHGQLPERGIARRLLERLPDTPRWVEARAMLLEGAFGLSGDPDAGSVLRHVRLPLAVVIGAPEREQLHDGLRGADRWLELLAGADSEAAVRAALPAWDAAVAVLHTRPARAGPVDRSHRRTADVVVAAPAPAALIERLPPAWRGWAAASAAVAAKLDGDAVVSLCHAGAVTARWWDVGVETIASHRRLGHARACFHALDHWLSSRGLAPVWGALTDNTASMGMAAALGFTPIDSILVFTPPARG